jgi:uncharacterized protein
MLRHIRGLAFAFLLAAPSTLAAQAATVTGGTISASGQGEAKVTPDRVAVLINVQTRGATAAATASDNATRTKAVFDAMARLGLPKDQVTTEGYSVYPEMQYNRADGGSRVIGYVANNTIRVESRQTDQAGPIIDAALTAGANNINGVSFYAQSIDEPRRAAISFAVASARADADAMARAAGGTVGELLELSTNGPTAVPRRFDAIAVKAANSAVAAPTTMNPGEQTVNVYVTARWRFVPNR